MHLSLHTGLRDDGLQAAVARPAVVQRPDVCTAVDDDMLLLISSAPAWWMPAMRIDAMMLWRAVGGVAACGTTGAIL
jgi:hypothetical protein